MIDNLLEVTRLEAGKLVVEPERVSIRRGGVRHAQHAASDRPRERRHAVVRLAPDLPSAHADQMRLRQILTILLDNAIKFTGEGGAASIQAAAAAARSALPAAGSGRHRLRHRSRAGEAGSSSGCIRSRSRPRPAARARPRPVHLQRTGDASRGSDLVDRRPQKGSTFSFTLPVFALDSSIAPRLKEAVNQ